MRGQSANVEYESLNCRRDRDLGLTSNVGLPRYLATNSPGFQACEYPSATNYESYEYEYEYQQCRDIAHPPRNTIRTRTSTTSPDRTSTRIYTGSITHITRTCITRP
eukprot:scaffold187467_cov18-Prasinocladus_malaysianus.AAC.1